MRRVQLDKIASVTLRLGLDKNAVLGDEIPDLLLRQWVKQFLRHQRHLRLLQFFDFRPAHDRSFVLLIEDRDRLRRRFGQQADERAAVGGQQLIRQELLPDH